MHASKEQQASLTKIKKRSCFLKVQSKGRKWVSHGLIVQTAPNEEGIKRIGYTVSKRVDKSAVKRNRIKRRLRAAAADVLPEGAKNGYDYILVGRPLTAARPYETLCEDLRWCLRKMGLEK
jgi:ribonuclease P protein component